MNEKKIKGEIKNKVYEEIKNESWFLKKINYVIKDITNEKIFNLIKERISEEDFIDAVVGKINRKQLKK